MEAIVDAEKNIELLRANLEKVLRSWADEQMSFLGKLKTAFVSLESEVQEQSPNNIDMLIEKLKHIDLESSSNLDIQDSLKEADQYNFLQKRQTLLSKIQSVFTSKDRIKCRFLRMRDQAKKVRTAFTLWHYSLTKDKPSDWCGKPAATTTTRLTPY